ncbi:MAG: glycosyltransferase family 2 protein, partial [Betaproteobacteria bacterium]
MTEQKKSRLLVFVVAYNAERTLETVLSRIPPSLAADYEVEILAIDDASGDRTFEIGQQIKTARSLSFPLRVLFNPINQGYGGNQKIGYHYALKNNFDFVALLHGDGQYAPEVLPELLKPLAEDAADAVFGSRMLTRGVALKGGMPRYKFVGNKILTWCQNRLLRTAFSEFHSGYRVYSTAALKKIPFDRNTNDFHFDTEIIIQLVIAGMRVRELPIPTYYGDEICHVNGIRYAWNVIITTVKSRIQEWSILYDSKFDCGPARQKEH